MSERSIVHGTMLYDTDIENMLNAITPSRAKLESHKVKSVESRITMVKKIKPEFGFERFHSELTAGLETGRYELTEADVARVEELERRYYDEDWIENGKN